MSRTLCTAKPPLGGRTFSQSEQLAAFLTRRATCLSPTHLCNARPSAAVRLQPRLSLWVVHLTLRDKQDCESRCHWQKMLQQHHPGGNAIARMLANEGGRSGPGMHGSCSPHVHRPARPGRTGRWMPGSCKPRTRSGSAGEQAAPAGEAAVTQGRGQVASSCQGTSRIIPDVFQVPGRLGTESAGKPASSSPLPRSCLPSTLHRSPP